MLLLLASLLAIARAGVGKGQLDRAVLADVWDQVQQRHLELHSVHDDGRSSNGKAQLSDTVVQFLLRSSEYLHHDPLAARVRELHGVSSQWKVQVSSIGMHRVARSRLHVHGVPVHGVTRVMHFAANPPTHSSSFSLLRTHLDGHVDSDQAAIEALPHALPPLHAFTLSYASLLKALSGSTTLLHQSVQRQRVYMVHNDGIKAVWKVRLPNSNPMLMMDAFVEDASGKVLKKDKSARSSTVYTDAQFSQTKDVILEDLLSVAPGAYLQGKHFSLHNCCDFLVCLDGSMSCAVSEARCATSDDSRSSMWRNMQRVEIPLEMYYALGEDLLQLWPGGTIHVEGPSCTGLPKAQYPWSATPFDSGTTSQQQLFEDEFVEVQLYHDMEEVLDFARALLQDSSFCLGGDSMQCDQLGEPLLTTTVADNVTVSSPLLPLHVFGNVGMPDILGALEDAIDRAFALKRLPAGQSWDDPLEWESLSVFVNAFFLPTFMDDATFEQGSYPFLSTFFLTRPYNLLAFGQGDVDLGYDSTASVHEFGHAFRHHFVPNMASYAYDAWGTNAEPGAIDEAFADYLSAIRFEHPMVGEYAFMNSPDGYLRTVDNDASCPAGLVNEVHEDSPAWSGALWSARQSLAAGERGDYDRAVVAALALASVDETFLEQSQKLLDVLQEHPNPAMASAHQALTQQFSQRGINPVCRRVRDAEELRSSGDSWLVVDGPTVHLAKAPFGFQVRLPVSEATTDFELSFNMSDTVGADPFGMLGNGLPWGGMAVQAAVSIGCPVRWEYSNGDAVARGCYQGNKDAQLALQDTASAANFFPGKTGSYDVTISYEVKGEDAAGWDEEFAYVSFVNIADVGGLRYDALAGVVDYRISGATSAAVGWTLCWCWCWPLL